MKSNKLFLGITLSLLVLWSFVTIGNLFFSGNFIFKSIYRAINFKEQAQGILSLIICLIIFRLLYVQNKIDTNRLHKSLLSEIEVIKRNLQDINHAGNNSILLNRSSGQQDFDSLFYNRFQMFSLMIDSLTYKDNSGNIFKGYDSFKYFWFDFANSYHNIREQETRLEKISGPSENISTPLPAEDYLRIINSAYIKSFICNLSDINHYFKCVINLLGFIKERSLINSFHYIETIKDKLTDYEYILIFYSCLCSYNGGNAKIYLEYFSFFDKLPKSLVIDQRHLLLYKDKAYKQNVIV